MEKKTDNKRGNPLPSHHRLLFPISKQKKKGIGIPSHRQESIYDGLGYTSRGALAGMRNSSISADEYNVLQVGKGQQFLNCMKTGVTSTNWNMSAGSTNSTTDLTVTFLLHLLPAKIHHRN